MSPGALGAVARDDGSVPVTYGDAAVDGSAVPGYLASGGEQLGPAFGEDGGTRRLTDRPNGDEVADGMVHAVNAAGDGADGETELTTTPAREPEMPTDVTLVSEDAGSVTIFWIAPTENGGSALTGDYIVTTPARSYSCSRQGDGARSSRTLSGRRVTSDGSVRRRWRRNRPERVAPQRQRADVVAGLPTVTPRAREPPARDPRRRAHVAPA